MSAYVDSLMGSSEKVLLIERQHWFAWVPRLILALFIILIITAVCVVALPFTAGLSLYGLVLNIVPIWTFVVHFLNWYNETYIVTNRRIIQTAGVINKRVIDSSLEKINDVVLTQSLVGRIMDFGNLEILTASDVGLNKLHHIQSPVRFKIAMLNAKEAMHDMTDIDDTGQAPAHPHQHDIPEMIAELNDLRKKGLITDAEFQEKRAKLMSEI